MQEAVGEWLFEKPASNDAVLALVEFASVIAADRLMGEITRDPVNDERDAFHQVIALAAAGGWLNDIVRSEWVDRVKREAGGYGTKPKASQDEGARVMSCDFVSFLRKPDPATPEGQAE